MDELMLLSVSIGVFTLMVTGLVLTVREFKNNIIVEEPVRASVRPSQVRPPRGEPRLRRVA